MTPPDTVPADPASTPESSNQLIVALAIVAALVVLGAGAVIAGIVSGQWTALGVGTILGTIIGILGNALNAPSGIGKVLTAAKQVPQVQPKDPS